MESEHLPLCSPPVWSAGRGTGLHLKHTEGQRVPEYEPALQAQPRDTGKLTSVFCQQEQVALQHRPPVALRVEELERSAGKPR